MKNILLYLIDYVSQTVLGEYLQHTKLYYNTSAAVGTFDKYCRVAFPAGFVLINIVSLAKAKAEH